MVFWNLPILDPALASDVGKKLMGKPLNMNGNRWNTLAGVQLFLPSDHRYPGNDKGGANEVIDADMLAEYKMCLDNG